MSTSFRYCDACGAANRPQARFCVGCGQTMAASPSSSPATIVLPTATGLLQASHLLNNRYRIIAEAGRGGMGAVYKAADEKFGGRLVAVKELSQSGLTTPTEIAEATRAFEREAMLLARLKHPHLPSIYDHFSENGHWYLVMDFIMGETLEARLAQVAPSGLPLDEVLRLAEQLCDVLEYLHEQQPPIIFRDLKPANAMVTPKGHVYLIDFGIARLFKPGQLADTMYFGSPGCAAPEQYGKAQTTVRSDIYSLGATLHQMLTGRDPADSPFMFAPVRQYCLQAPMALEQLIERMVQHDLNQRPATVGDVRAEIRRIVAAPLNATQSNLTRPVRPPTTERLPTALPAPPARQPGRRPLLLSGLALIVVLALVTILLVRNVGPQPNGGQNTPVSSPSATTKPMASATATLVVVAASPTSALVVSPPLANTPVTWSPGAGLAVARHGLAVAADSAGNIYAIGGANPDSSSLTVVERHTPNTDAWTIVAPLPTGRHALAAATSIDGHIYAIGGSSGNGSANALDTVEAYDPVQNVWAEVPSLPTARDAPAAVEGPDGRIYVLGGYTNSHTTTAEVDAYSPQTGTWSVVAPMPTARGALDAVLGADGLIYAIGGYNKTNLNVVDAYSPNTNTWQTVAPLLTPTEGATAVAGPDQRIYVIGGDTETVSNGYYATRSVEVYTPGAAAWTLASSQLTVPRYSFAAITTKNGFIDVIGGANNGNDTNALSSMEYWAP